MKSIIAIGLLSCAAFTTMASERPAEDLPFNVNTIYNNQSATNPDRATTITESTRINERVCMILYRDGFKFAAFSASNKFKSSIMVHGIQSAGGELKMDLGVGAAIPLGFSVNDGFFLNSNKLDKEDIKQLVKVAGKMPINFFDPSGDNSDQYIIAPLDMNAYNVFKDCVNRLK